MRRLLLTVVVAVSQDRRILVVLAVECMMKYSVILGPFSLFLLRVSSCRCFVVLSNWHGSLYVVLILFLSFGSSPISFCHNASN